MANALSKMTHIEQCQGAKASTIISVVTANVSCTALSCLVCQNLVRYSPKLFFDKMPAITTTALLANVTLRKMTHIEKYLGAKVSTLSIDTVNASATALHCLI